MTKAFFCSIFILCVKKWKLRKKYDKNQCKKELGLKEDKQYVLILNGSMGFGNVEGILEKLTSEIKNANFIVACGNNGKLLKRLEEK